MKIIEWNINHRLGYSKAKMPEWVADVIRKKRCRYSNINRMQQ